MRHSYYRLPLILLSAFTLFGCSNNPSSSDGGSKEDDPKEIKIACLGDSLTYGHMWHDESYPVYLSNSLNEDGKYRFEVKNLGINGASITGYGGSWNNPNEKYQNKAEFRQCLEFAPDYIFIMLGSNDSSNWDKARLSYVSDYNALIDGIYDELPDVEIIIMISPPVKDNNSFSVPNYNIANYVNPLQKQIADDYGLDIIDVAKAFNEHEGGYDSLLRNDGVHFSVSGAQLVANLIVDYLTK